MRQQSEAERLDEHGYVVLPNLASTEFVVDLNRRLDELLVEESDDAGSEFKREPGCVRFANLMNKGEVFSRVISHKRILALIGHVLGEFKLSSLNARIVSPHGSTRQPLHVDMNAIPDDRGPWVCNVLWMLQDFTIENGPLRVVPGSHLSMQRPQDALEDPVADHPDQILVTGQKGTVVVFNAHLWHSGIENQTASPRRAIHAFYCRRDKPQQQHQKRLISPEIQNAFPSSIRQLLALDDPENDRLSQSVAETSGFMK